MVKRNILALTLMGLMAAVLIFPVCANALEDGEVAPTLTAPEADAVTYELTPTLEWSAASGATHFYVTIAEDENFSTVNADEVVEESLLTYTIGDESKLGWCDKKQCGDGQDPETDDCCAATTNDEYKACKRAACETETPACLTYSYDVETALTVGKTYYWKVEAKRDDATGVKNPFAISETTTSETSNFKVVGNIALSLSAAPTSLNVNQGNDTVETVTVTVSLDNSAETSGGVPVNGVNFTINYDSATFTIENTDYTLSARMDGGSATLNPSGSSVAVGLTAASTAITAGTGGLVDLVFTAKKETATAGDLDFKFADGTTMSSESVSELSDDSKFTVGEAQSVTVAVIPAVKEGDLNGDDAVDLKDAILALKVLTGIPITAEGDISGLSNYAAAYGKITVGVLVSILVQVAAG